MKAFVVPLSKANPQVVGRTPLLYNWLRYNRIFYNRLLCSWLLCSWLLYDRQC